MDIKDLKRIGLGTIVLILIAGLTGCSYLKSIDILQTLSEEEIHTFYGEGRWRSYLNNELIHDVDFKEWKGTGKNYHIKSNTKIDKELYKESYGMAAPEELIYDNVVRLGEEDTYNENQMIVYLPHKNEYSIKENLLVDEVNPKILLGINAVLNAGGPKDYATRRIHKLAKEYDLVIEDNIKVNGILTQHIIGTSKNAQIDEIQEIWIDQTTWLIIKEYYRSGNYVEEYEYTKFQLNSKIDESLFDVEIPDDAKVSYIDKQFAKVNEEITLDEAARKLQRPIFYLEEKEGIVLESSLYIEELGDEYGRVELIYKLPDKREVIIQCSPSSPLYEQVEWGYEKITVQGEQAIYQEEETIKIIEFIRYNTVCDIYVKNSDMNKEELIEIANRLLIKEELQ